MCSRFVENHVGARRAVFLDVVEGTYVRHQDSELVIHLSQVRAHGCSARAQCHYLS